MTSSRAERYFPWIAATALLAPLLGGQLSLDPQPLAPGGLFTALFREPSGASLAHFLIFLPLLGGLLFALGRRAVIQVPQLRTTILWGAFSIAILASLAMSGYKFQTAQAITEWLAYVVALFATVALVGRSEGPRWVVSAFSAGCAIVSLVAIKEYVTQADPTWRVLGNWMNPNALAAIMAMGALASLASAGGGRLHLVAGSVSAALCTTALVLSGSKGGMLALAAGGLVYGLASVIWTRSARPILLLVACLAGLGIAYGLVAVHPRPAASPSASAFGRMAGAGATSEQSAGFRRLLWQTSVALIKDNPMGRGLGTFKNHSSRPGLVTQTQLAHQSYLQMGVEAGVLGMALFLVALLVSLGDVLRGSRALPAESGVLRAGVFGALASMAVHSAIDSDFSHFGLGLSFFMLLGVLFQLSADATVPEFSPRNVRGIAGFVGVACGISLLVFGLVDVRLGNLRYAIAARDLPLAQATFDSAAGLAGQDPRFWSLASRIAQTPNEMKDRIRRSILLGPTPASYRMLADLLESEGDLVGAERELLASLTIDPNNLFSLRRLLAVRQKRDPDTAPDIARRLVAIEDSTYFKVRSLPELVPTETFEARIFLAERLTGQDRAAMLRPAVTGYRSFARQTVPQVLMFAKSGLDGGYGGITKESATSKLKEGIAAAKSIADVESTKELETALTALSE